MALYFFDLKSAGIVPRDGEGMELSHAGAAHDMAFGALVDSARDAFLGGQSIAIFWLRSGTARVQCWK